MNNDFTKEELEDILWHVTTKAIVPVGGDLVPKIQSMIDNYSECEHDGWKECRFCGENFRGIE